MRKSFSLSLFISISIFSLLCSSCSSSSPVASGNTFTATDTQIARSTQSNSIETTTTLKASFIFNTDDTFIYKSAVTSKSSSKSKLTEYVLAGTYSELDKTVDCIFTAVVSYQEEGLSVDLSSDKKNELLNNGTDQTLIYIDSLESLVYETGTSPLYFKKQ